MQTFKEKYTNRSEKTSFDAQKSLFLTIKSETRKNIERNLT